LNQFSSILIGDFNTETFETGVLTSKGFGCGFLLGIS